MSRNNPHRREGFPNGMFGSCDWWSRGLDRSGVLFGRRHRRRHHFPRDKFPKWILWQRSLDSKDILQGYHVYFPCTCSQHGFFPKCPGLVHLAWFRYLESRPRTAAIESKLCTYCGKCTQPTLLTPDPESQS